MKIKQNETSNFLKSTTGIIVGAGLGYLILKILFGDRLPCPNCKYLIEQGIPQCPRCGVWLSW